MLDAAEAECASPCPADGAVAVTGATVPWWGAPTALSGVSTIGCRRGRDGIGSGFMAPILTPVIAALGEVVPWTSSPLNFSLSCSINGLRAVAENLHLVQSSHLAAHVAFQLLPQLTVTPGGTG